MHRLPRRIGFVIAGIVALFLLTTGLSILWMTRALDHQAQAQAATQVEIARANLLARVRMITLDYAKWDAAHEAARSRDVAWILDNIGSAALIGQAVQLVVVWGGAFGTGDLGWQDDGVVEPRAGLLPASFLAATAARIAPAEPGAFDGSEFFAWHDGALFVMGASHFEAVEHAAALPEAERFAGQLLMGIRVSEAVVADIADSLLLTGAGVSRDRPADRPALELAGLDGRPVAWLAWDRPDPGSRLLRRMLPLLSLVAAVAATLAVAGSRLMRRGAQDLVAAEQRASAAARTDALTGLPNRAAFNEALDLPAPAGGRAILFLDLNGFKGVNDSLGHEAGDRVIIATAARLAAVAGPGAMLARIAGDEFVLLVAGPDARERIEALALAVAAVFDAPFEVLGHHLHLQAAIGYAVQDEDGRAGPDLVRQADLAMYEGKRLKERAPVAFRAMMEEASQNASLVERALRAALASRPEELSVAYQPIVTADGIFHHAEALARWTARDHGPIPPSRFVAVAEKAGLVIELGRSILGHLCRDLRDHPALRVSVNISPLQLAAPGFIPDLVAELDRMAIDPHRIEVELTESVLVRDPALAARHLRELQAVGFRIALDDFGTGYSSVAYLEQLSFNTLKVDRSFVSGVRRSPKRQALLRAMIQMAHGLDLRVVCEGVETAEDLRLLQEFDCDLMQGFLFDRPLAIGDLAARWLAGGRQVAA